MHQPIIGVTPVLRSAQSERYELGRGYCRALLEAGCVPVILPFAPPEQAQAMLDACDGLLLSGGEDVEPARYGERTLDACGAISEARDAFEWALLAAAERRGMSVLGICRGMQLLNVFYGGSLWQDVESQLSLPWQLHSPGHYESAHTVTVAPQTRLAGIFGAGELWVNSSHHQCVKATTLTVAARDAQGVAEAVERPGERFVLGVQWHPERMEDGRLFQAFAAACRR